MRSPGRFPTRSAAILLIVLALARPASADAGPPIFWMAGFHLVFGNLVIGLIEGVLLALLFRVRARRAIPIMVLANYASMIAGMLAVIYVLAPMGGRWMGPAPLYAAPRVLLLLLALSFVLTVILEWPFCFWMLSGRKQRLRKSLIASLAAQIASYALLVPFYASAHGISLYANLTLDPSLSFAARSRATVYFIALDGSAWQARPDGSQRRKVVDAGIRNPEARLVLRHDPPLPEPKEGEDAPAVAGHWDLWVVHDPREDASVRLLQGLNGTSAASRARREKDGLSVEGTTWEDMGAPVDLRRPGERAWNVFIGEWEGEGVEARNDGTNQKWSAAFETPFAQWLSRSGTLLPGDLLIYQLDEQIVALDLRARRIGLIARGRGPAVILDEPR